MIPLVDCSPIAEKAFEDICDEDFNKVAREIGEAMTGVGMCNLINHGIDKQKIVNVYEVSKKFFNLPSETKLKYKKLNALESFNGYAGPGDEIVNESQKNSTELRESWDIWGLDGHDERNFPNQEVPDFKLIVDDIRNELDNLAKKILRCIEICLQLDDGVLTSNHKNLEDYSIKTQTVLRSLYYYTLNPNDDIPLDAIRCGEHSDWGTITLLIQDMVGGLEVKTLEGEWIDATPVENAILLNSAQLLEYWTGGRFHAALHRVRIKTGDEIAKTPRQSFVYFLNPDADAEVFPLIPILNEKKAYFTRFNNKSVNAYEYFQQRVDHAY